MRLTLPIHFLRRRAHWGFGSILLALAWVGGFLAGVLTASRMGAELPALVYSLCGQPVTVSGELVMSVLPCLLCVYGATLGELWLLPLVGGWKAFGFGFAGCAVSMTFGQSSWLVRGLLLFSSWIILVPLYLFSLRHIHGKTSRVHRDAAVLMSISVAVCVLDYFAIAPFLCMLFS